MVFLLYEWVVGRPPPETVRAIATYVGLIFIILLMLFVLVLDLKRRGLMTWLSF
jgi:regulator of sigma E protease